MTITPLNPPFGAAIELTILIDSDAWKEYQDKGYTDSDIENLLKAELTRALSHDRERKLVDGLDELHVRKYF